MKNDRAGFMSQAAIFPNAAFPMNGMMFPNYMNDNNYNNLENRVSTLEKKVKNLENRISRLENPYQNNNQNYQNTNNNYPYQATQNNDNYNGEMYMM